MSAPKSATQARYTAAQIARASGKPDRTIRSIMRDIAPTLEMAGGVRAWAREAIPQQLRESITEVGKKQNRSAESVLASAAKPFAFPIAVSDLEPERVEHAFKLQRALRPMLEQVYTCDASEGEFERLGTEQYRHVFGHSISARHWRRLFRRTIDLARSSATENWSDVRLYVSWHRTKKTSIKVFDSVKYADLADLHELMAGFSTPTAPTQREKAALWGRAFELFSAAVARGRPEKKQKGALLEFLMNHAPWIAAGREALRVNFDRKYRA